MFLHFFLDKPCSILAQWTLENAMHMNCFAMLNVATEIFKVVSLAGFAAQVNYKQKDNMRKTEIGFKAAKFIMAATQSAIGSKL